MLHLPRSRVGCEHASSRLSQLVARALVCAPRRAVERSLSVALVPTPHRASHGCTSSKTE